MMSNSVGLLVGILFCVGMGLSALGLILLEQMAKRELQKCKVCKEEIDKLDDRYAIKAKGHSSIGIPALDKAKELKVTKKKRKTNEK